MIRDMLLKILFGSLGLIGFIHFSDWFFVDGIDDRYFTILMPHLYTAVLISVFFLFITRPR